MDKSATLPPRSQRAWDNFRTRVAELGGEVLEPQYLGNKNPHRCLCPAGHECSPAPNNLLYHGMCRVCAGNDSATAWVNFRRQVSELGGVVLETEWLGKDTPHRCLCASGHECKPSPGSIRGGQGMCRVCAGMDPATAWENFRRRIVTLGGEVLEPSWLGALVPHLCRCADGHECKPFPNNIQQGQGMCRVCADRDNPVTAQRKQAARERFYARVAELGGTVLDPEWRGVESPQRCRCANGHMCNPRPHSVLSGQGICPVCAWKAQDVLYVVRDPIAQRVKFGITNRDGSLRLRNHSYRGFTEVVYLQTGLPESFAAHVEQKIKLSLVMAGAIPVQGREYFSDEHTALIMNEISIWLALDSAN